MGGLFGGSRGPTGGGQFNSGALAGVDASDFGAFPSTSSAFSQEPADVVGDPFFDPMFGSQLLGGQQGQPGATPYVGPQGQQTAPQQPQPITDQQTEQQAAATSRQNKPLQEVSSGLGRIAKLLGGPQQPQGAGWIRPQPQPPPQQPQQPQAPQQVAQAVQGPSQQPQSLPPATADTVPPAPGPVPLPQSRPSGATAGPLTQLLAGALAQAPQPPSVPPGVPSAAPGAASGAAHEPPALAAPDQMSRLIGVDQDSALRDVLEGRLPSGQNRLPQGQPAPALAPAPAPGSPLSLSPQDYVRSVFAIESGGDPYSRTGKNKGLGQFGPAEERMYGLNARNRHDPRAQANALQREYEHHRGILRQALGREPEPWESYFTHQQGIGGGPALLRANPAAPAWQVLRRFYDDNTAVRAIGDNTLAGHPLKRVPPEQITVGQFREMWRERFNRSYSRSAA